MENQKLHGMTGFSVVWVGQLISLTGSAMTQFALTYWVFEKTGQATTLTLMILSANESPLICHRNSEALTADSSMRPSAIC